MSETEILSFEIEREKLKLERELRMAEIDLDSRRVEIEEAKHELAKSEHSLAQAEHIRGQWRNPLVVAIFAATIAALGNAIIALTNGNSQRELEAQKAESLRISEMIKTDGNSELAAENLEFLMKAGLVDDEERLKKLEQFLLDRAPGAGPSTSSGGAAAVVQPFVGEFNHRVPSTTRVVTEVILTDTDTISVEREVNGLQQMRVSYHYLIDENGGIHSLVSEKHIAFHVTGRNSSSIGIGILHKLGTDYPPKQLEALRGLLKEIADRHNIQPYNILSRNAVQPDRSQDIEGQLESIRNAVQ